MLRGGPAPGGSSLAHALAFTRGLLRADRFGRRHDQARFLTLMLFLFGDQSAELRAHEGLEEGAALQVGAVAQTRSRGSGRGGEFRATGAGEVIGGVLQVTAQADAD